MKRSKKSIYFVLALRTPRRTLLPYACVVLRAAALHLELF